jgi:hypothetical protein
MANSGREVNGISFVQRGASGESGCRLVEVGGTATWISTEAVKLSRFLLYTR